MVGQDAAPKRRSFAGTLASTGDVPDIEMFRKFMAQVKGRGKSVVPFIKPWNKDAVAARCDVAKEAGCDICGMDVDAAGLTILRTLAAPVSVKKPEELAELAKELGYTSLGISNHGNTNGLVKHYYACKENGIVSVPSRG